LQTILYKLEKELGYEVTWKVLDSIDFGLPQSRKRIFIVGTQKEKIDLEVYHKRFKPLKEILETGLETLDTKFTQKLFERFTMEELYGKAIKDKRGGTNSIHSWDIGIKGAVSEEQIDLLNKLFKERRKKHWAAEIGIDWMDGMPLTHQQICTFFRHDHLEAMLDDLVNKGYLKFEHPKKLVYETTEQGQKKYRAYDRSKAKGYNIVTGKLSFEINKILDPNDIAPTLVATDATRLAVPDNGGLRRLTIREGLRLFGYPEWYKIPVKKSFAFNLLGNTVAVPVVEHVAQRLAKSYANKALAYTQ
jgi:DNA (cytosine-5)-methyltransferase 1